MTSFLAFLAVAPRQWANWIADFENPEERLDHIDQLAELMESGYYGQTIQEWLPA